MMRWLVFALAVAALMGAACGEKEAPPAPTPTAQNGRPVVAATPATPSADGQPKPSVVARKIEFETVEIGQQSGIGGPGPSVVKIETQAAWDEFWSRHKSLVMPAPPPPTVDFSQEMVIAVLDRQEVSGGYRLEISGIEEIEGGMRVRASKGIPGERCIVTLAMSQPFHIVRTAKSDLEPELEVSEETYSCG